VGATSTGSGSPAGLIALSGRLTTGVRGFSTAMVLYDSQISLFYPNVGKLCALIGPINDFCD
jgi:hypothetical protein